MVSRLVLSALAMLAFGCCSSSTRCIDKICPPCTPTVETDTVYMPITSCPRPPEIDPIHMPGYPVYPGDDSTQEQRKSYYAQVAAAVQQREAIMQEYIGMLLSIIDYYRSIPHSLAGHSLVGSGRLTTQPPLQSTNQENTVWTGVPGGAGR